MYLEYPQKRDFETAWWLKNRSNRLRLCYLFAHLFGCICAATDCVFRTDRQQIKKKCFDYSKQRKVNGFKNERCLNISHRDVITKYLIAMNEISNCFVLRLTTDGEYRMHRTNDILIGHFLFSVHFCFSYHHDSIWKQIMRRRTTVWLYEEQRSDKDMIENTCCRFILQTNNSFLYKFRHNNFSIAGMTN